MKKILVIKAHPREESYCNALVEQYTDGARTAGAEIKTISLHDLQLEPWLKYGWSRNHDSVPAFTPDLQQAKYFISWCDHIVFAYPTYWAMPPALLALFIEVITTSGFAFKYHKPLFNKIPVWDRLLKGRTAALIVTMDAPPLYMRLHDQDPGGKMMRDVLRFVGIRLRARHYFGSVIMSSEETKQRWLKRAYRIGVREGR